MNIIHEFFRISSTLFLFHLNHVFTNQSKIISRIESKADDMIFFYTTFQQMMIKQYIKQVAFAATADSGNNLNQSIVLFSDQLIQISISFDFYFRVSLQKIYAMNYIFLFYSTSIISKKSENDMYYR